MKSVILLSGGLDSTVALAQTVAESAMCDDIYPIYVSYGNRAPVELVQAIEIVTHYRSLVIPHVHVLKIVDINDVRKVMLNEDQSIPHEAPYRNALFTLIAAAYAVQVGADRIIDGNHLEDSLTGFADGSKQASGVLNSLLEIHAPEQARSNIPQLYNPLANDMKVDVIKKGVRFDAPLKLTNSCYDNSYLVGNKHCGKCESCKFRKSAFKAAEVPDPTKYIE